MASPFIAFSDLVSNVVTYFDMNIAIAKRDTESATDSIYDSIFHVDNMTEVEFFDSRGKKICIDKQLFPSSTQNFLFYDSL